MPVNAIIQMNRLPEEDLQHIFDQTAQLWDEMRNKSIFITGGTGFFGIWLLESFLFANAKVDLNARMIVLTRSIDSFYKQHPYLEHEYALSLLEGDITNFVYPDKEIDFIIHAASGGTNNLDDKITGSLVTISIDGTRHLLEFARKCKCKKLLYTSSGAVYGIQPQGTTHVGEDYTGAPYTLYSKSTYGESKRYCELLSALYSSQYNFEIKIARCFAFIGPYLPLESNYAIGNFINDVLKNKQIEIQGDGTPRRSYLYSSDLMIWLWTILFKGGNLHPYNVGSEYDLSIFELAECIRDLTNPSLAIKVKKISENQLIERYVPSVRRANEELGLIPLITLNDAIIKTINWYKLKN